MFNATDLIEREFNKEKIKCTPILLPDQSCITAGFSNKNCSFTLNFVSTDDSNTVCAIAEDIAQVPEDKLTNACIAINFINQKYRYAKFSVAPNGAIMATYDFPAKTPSEAVGPIAVEIVMRFYEIVDEAYSDIMRAVWG